MSFVKATGLLLIAALGLSACNTLEGAGEDIRRGGAAISDAARDLSN
ncbi:putative small secreted protein [Rubricella aquisinus]|uniref:Putative small secreted protein n=1 Tax=Rubricella aquisinus TaxID=2028108 RepID=A0A840X5I8_9RHOB|nr:entericidin A/B family lipoprotein [Rubricella aquisinus]MBB5515967.1 putative small secreted protein [Rubricella aquisinus]